MDPNLHIVTGPGRTCLCGCYEGREIRCHELVNTLSRLEQWATALSEGTAANPPTPEEILKISKPLKALIQNLQ